MSAQWQIQRGGGVRGVKMQNPRSATAAGLANALITLQNLHAIYLVKMTTIAWLLQFHGSFNRGVISLKEFQNTIYHPSNPLTIPSSFKEQAETLVW